MSDRYSLQANCSVCGKTDLDKDDEYGRELMMAPGESIDLACSKCGTVWRFWIDVVTNQKKIGQKRIETKKKL